MGQKYHGNTAIQKPRVYTPGLFVFNHCLQYIPENGFTVLTFHGYGELL
jgi:hypothetical protein